MTSGSDEPGKSATLPPSELNPLLNPILNKNLGRWAEVYFTNPPEKREQAVLHLLRELESTGSKDAPLPSSQARSSVRRAAMTTTQAHAVICGECGFENEAPQRFCGDCGAQLTPLVGLTITENARPAEREPHARDRATIDRAPQFGSILNLGDSAVPESRQQEASGKRLEPEEDALARSLEKEEASAPLRLSYRILIGAALVVTIVCLAYMAWRGGQTAPGRSAFPEQAPPAVTNQAGPASRVSQTLTPPQPAPAAAAATGSNAKLALTAQPPAPEDKRSGTSKDSVIFPADGNQELAQALNLLNGVGTERDSAQAAVWLWKAVEKKNTHATVLLGGLYLRGDGVQKNCDQGRVLLDAAADKGSKDAADLLQNLQAFGCQ